jgi:two-component system LytT family sensor kinase
VTASLSVGELLNIVGLTMGVALYAMLLVMVVRGGKTPAAGGHLDPLLLVTALLGLVWNASALPAYDLVKVGIEGPFRLLSAIGFSALGFLPAVVVHSVLRGERQHVSGMARRAIGIAAYVVSGAAMFLQFRAAWAGAPVPAPPAMRLLTYSFVALIVPLAIVTRDQPGSRRALWGAALATFAVSALHLSQFHRGDVAWPVELMGHHASVPLALAILYQDYPFALADLFLKRLLSLLAIVGVVFAAIATFGVGSRLLGSAVPLNAIQVALLVALWVATALIYPWLRGVSVWFVDTIVLQRPDYRSLRATIARKLQTHQDAAGLLSELCEVLAPALAARSVRWHELDERADGEAGAASIIVGTQAAARLTTGVHDGGLAAGKPVESIAALVMVPTSEPPHYAISIADLTGGRRLLSDDLVALEAIAILVARRLDGIRLTAERYEREIREGEIDKLVTEAELRALRAQINPHFLFNALTTIGYLIQVAPTRALQTLMRLTSLLRAVLRSDGELTTLGRELELVEAYLDIERARFEERLNVTIDVPPSLRHICLPPLVLQQLVENAVKHGIAKKQVGGQVVVTGHLDPLATNPPRLVLSVRDTGAGSSVDALTRGRDVGLGLRNIERRLDSQYGPAASFSISSTLDVGTVVEVRLPVETHAPAELVARQTTR